MDNKEEPKQTTKECPDCGNTHLALFQIDNEKYCVDCGKTIPWFLEEGQKRDYT